MSLKYEPASLCLVFNTAFAIWCNAQGLWLMPANSPGVMETSSIGTLFSGWMTPSLLLIGRWGAGKKFHPLPDFAAGTARSLPWREAGPPNHHDDKVDLDQ